MVRPQQLNSFLLFTITGSTLLSLSLTVDAIGGNAEGFGAKQTVTLAAGTVLILLAEWQNPESLLVNLLRRLTSLAWGGTGLLGFYIYPKQWSFTHCVLFCLTGVLIEASKFTPPIIKRQILQYLRYVSVTLPAHFWRLLQRILEPHPYGELFRVFFGRKNSQSFLVLDRTLWQLLLILGGIGTLRNLLEVHFGITYTPKWYSLDADIFFVMFVFPIHLCFWGAVIITLFARLFNRQIPFLPLVAFLYYLQILHLLVPIIDRMGARLHFPQLFLIFGTDLVSPYFCFPLPMTLGIMVIWSLSAYLTLKILHRTFQIPLLQTLAIGVLAFITLYLPIYHLWPTWNTIFAMATGAPPEHFLIKSAEFKTVEQPFWGYGFYFLLTGLIGIHYYRQQMQQATNE